jgi:hypothetical protein
VTEDADLGTFADKNLARATRSEDVAIFTADGAYAISIKAIVVRESGSLVAMLVTFYPKAAHVNCCVSARPTRFARWDQVHCP